MALAGQDEEEAAGLGSGSLVHSKARHRLKTDRRAAVQLARLVDRLLKYGEDYVAQGMAEYEQADRERTVQHLIRKAEALGYKLLPTTAATPQDVPA